MPLPQIKIRYNRLLDPIFVFYCQNNPEIARLGWDKWTPPTKEELDKRVTAYQQAWDIVESRVLQGMCNLLELDFKRNVIDVHIVSGNPRQLSWPLIIKSGYPPDDFVGTLMHELIHVLCSDNYDILPDLETIYQEETLSTRRHIIVHAVLKHLYLDILNNPAMLNANIALSRAHSTPEYARAWDIVESKGSREIIEDLKKQYRKK